jgi:hypothetical protein
VLNVIGQTALAHRPARCQVWRRGHLVTRMIWAEPLTMLLLSFMPTAAGPGNASRHRRAGGANRQTQGQAPS